MVQGIQGKRGGKLGGATAGGYRQSGGGGGGDAEVREVAETNKPAAATLEATISFTRLRHQPQ